MIPDLVTQGDRKVLPPGEHLASWNEFKERFGTGSFRRKKILAALLDAARMLRSAGCSALFIDGSFTSDKHLPDDWDGCYCTTGLDWGKVDPLLVDMTDAKRDAIKRKYKADLFAADCIERSSGVVFREFFQSDDAGRPKGIIVLELRTLP